MSLKLPIAGAQLTTEDIVITTDEGDMSVHVVYESDQGQLPVVLLLMDAVGKRPLLHQMASVIASHGYFVMLPNLYYRQTAEFELDFSDDESLKTMSTLMRAIGNRMVARDVQALISQAAIHPSADADNVGVVGYCMSGPFSLYAAAEFPERIRCAASFYGVRLAVDKDDSPHLRLGNITGEIYVAAAEHDDFMPLEMVDRLERARRDAQTRGRVEVYAGTHHGFAFADRPAYDPDADHRHWTELLGLFARSLGGRPLTTD